MPGVNQGPDFYGPEIFSIQMQPSNHFQLQAGKWVWSYFRGNYKPIFVTRGYLNTEIKLQYHKGEY